MSVKRFKEINDLFKATGFEKRTEFSDFFVLKFEDIPEATTYSMPPYQKDFYQIALILDTTPDTSIEIDVQKSNRLVRTLYFLSPDHIFSWTRSERMTGYILYFKKEFLQFSRADFNKEFSFFEVVNNNMFTLQPEVISDLSLDLQRLYKQHYTDIRYKYRILQSYLLAFLYKVKGIEGINTQQKFKHSEQDRLVYQFINMVNHRFWIDKQVNVYADRLHTSVGYLNQVLKYVKGKTAKEFIDQRVLNEAKKQLKHTDFQIAEVAFNLGFEEPTHFTRFFKRHTGVTPKVYRSQ